MDKNSFKLLKLLFKDSDKENIESDRDFKLKDIQNFDDLLNKIFKTFSLVKKDYLNKIELYYVDTFGFSDKIIGYDELVDKISLNHLIKVHKIQTSVTCLDRVSPGSKTYFEKIKKFLICLICNGIFFDVVMCADCGQNYCRKCLQFKILNDEHCPLGDCFPIKIIEKIDKDIRKDMEAIKIQCKNPSCKIELNLLNFYIHDKIENCFDSYENGNRFIISLFIYFFNYNYRL